MPGRGRPVHPLLAPGRRRGRHPPPLHGDGASSPRPPRGPGGEPGSAGAWARPSVAPSPPPHRVQSPGPPRPRPRPPPSSPHGAARCGRGSAAILGRSRAEPSRAEPSQASAARHHARPTGSTRSQHPRHRQPTASALGCSAQSLARHPAGTPATASVSSTWPHRQQRPPPASRPPHHPHPPQPPTSTPACITPAPYGPTAVPIHTQMGLCILHSPVPIPTQPTAQPHSHPTAWAPCPAAAPYGVCSLHGPVPTRRRVLLRSPHTPRVLAPRPRTHPRFAPRAAPALCFSSSRRPPGGTGPVPVPQPRGRDRSAPRSPSPRPEQGGTSGVVARSGAPAPARSCREAGSGPRRAPGTEEGQRWSGRWQRHPRAAVCRPRRRPLPGAWGRSGRGESARARPRARQRSAERGAEPAAARRGRGLRSAGEGAPRPGTGGARPAPRASSGATEPGPAGAPGAGQPRAPPRRRSRREPSERRGAAGSRPGGAHLRAGPWRCAASSPSRGR